MAIDPAASPEASEVVAESLSSPAVGRLSLYFRELHRLLETGVESINSRGLGELVNVSAAVVRRDLSTLGAVGRRGVGYSIQALIESIGKVLGSGRHWRVVLVGVGSLGSALLRYRGFERYGFEVAEAFDNDDLRVGRRLGGLTVRHVNDMEENLRRTPAQLAVLAVPAEASTDLASRLAGCGVEGILNFAPTLLQLPASVAVVNVDLASELQRLVFSVQTRS